MLIRRADLARIKRNAKALYILDSFSEAYNYLLSKADDGVITDEIADKLADELSDECRNATGGQIERFIKILV